MGFHYVRFPLDIAFGARGGPKWSTQIVQLSFGEEQRNSLWAQSRRQYDVGYGVKSKADLQKVVDFFEERRGSFYGFLFKDPLDHSSSTHGVSPTDQFIARGDGAQKDFQLIKTYGRNFDPYHRIIKKPVLETVRVALNGTKVSAATFEIDQNTGLIHFKTAPPKNVRIHAGFMFDVPVRFLNDSLDVEITSFDAAQAPSIKVIEIRE